jgi:hypothetical protein
MVWSSSQASSCRVDHLIVTNSKGSDRMVPSRPRVRSLLHGRTRQVPPRTLVQYTILRSSRLAQCKCLVSSCCCCWWCNGISHRSTYLLSLASRRPFYLSSDPHRTDGTVNVLTRCRSRRSSMNIHWHWWFYHL